MVFYSSKKLYREKLTVFTLKLNRGDICTKVFVDFQILILNKLWPKNTLERVKLNWYIYRNSNTVIMYYYNTFLMVLLF